MLNYKVLIHMHILEYKIGHIDMYTHMSVRLPMCPIGVIGHNL